MTKFCILAAVVLAGIAGLGAPAQSQPDCLQIGRIWSWKPLTRRTLIVEDEMHRKFKVDLMGYCPALPFKLALGFKSNGAVNGLDCVRRGDEVISHDIGSRYTCPVMSVTPYTPAMERADKAAAARRQQGY